MTDYCDKTQAIPHQIRHYESCMNSTCSRSPSPVRRELWEPKHPPPQKFKNNRKLPLKPFDTVLKQGNNNARSRDRSPFLPPSRNGNRASTPNKSRDPLFTYTINEGPCDTDNCTQHFEVKIHNHSDSSLPSSRSKTPESGLHNPSVNDQVAFGKPKLQLELDTSRVPPIITITNDNSLSNAQQTSRTPPPTCSRSCACSSSCCTQPYPLSSQKTFEPCDSVCQGCPCPYLSSRKSSLKEDTATSPTKPFCTQPEVEPRSSVCPICPKSCPYSTSSIAKKDKALSPINPRSRSASPPPQRSSSPNNVHGGSDNSSTGTIEIKFDADSKVQVDWEDNVRPIKVDLPNGIISVRDQNSRFDDQVHSYDPQLEAFYISSCNQSGLPSPCKSRNISPCSLQLSDRESSTSIVHCPLWNPHNLYNYHCRNGAYLESNGPSRSPCSPSTSYSRSPKSKNMSKKELSQNSSFGSLEIYRENGEIITNIDWSSPISNANTCNPFSNHEGFDSRIKDDHLDTPKQPLSPILTLTPPTCANGQMKIEWTPRSPHHRGFKEMNPLVTSNKTRCEEVFRDVEHSYHHDEVKEEERGSHPQVTLQEQSHVTSPCIDLEYNTSIPSCKPSCSQTCCASPCDSCHGSEANCDCCCCHCNTECVAPVEGINTCTSLPPHLQSDWSANLRSSSSEMRTKPILYRDAQGHEHIMFADGSIEHLSRHCEPTTPAPSQPLKLAPPIAATTTCFEMPCAPCPLSPPAHCEPTTPAPSQPLKLAPPIAATTTCFEMPCAPCPLSPPAHCHDKHEEGKYGQYCANNFYPRSGDIVIRAHQRLPCMYPGKDNGQVAFFTSDYLDLQEGDSIVRLGKFEKSGQWCLSRQVDMYLRGSHGQWLFLGTTEGLSILFPLEADQNQVVRTPNKKLRLRHGDLVISTIPSPNSFYFWNPKKKMEVDHSHLLVRAYIGHPQVVDKNHNLGCCVPGHLPVGYVELYVKVKRIWLFLGRDEHMFTEHELAHFS